MAVAASTERAIRDALEPGEQLDIAVNAIEAGWLPVTWFGEFLAQPRAVALTDRALLISTSVCSTMTPDSSTASHSKTLVLG